MLSDTRDVWNPDQQQFVSTAMDIASGTEFGAVFWAIAGVAYEHRAAPAARAARRRELARTLAS